MPALIQVNRAPRKWGTLRFAPDKEAPMNDLAREIHHSQERMVRELRSLVADAEELLRHAARDAGSEFTAARERLEKGLKAARIRLADAEQAALDQVGDAARAADDYVHHNPWTAIGVGAGIGLVAGLLLARR
jgi:ElaB/YqjD/DUF883 family membrane-anchored ribosome-binding protein